MRAVKGLLLATVASGLMMSGCATVGDGDKTMKGAGLGALAGAALGAGVAAATGKNVAQGALIGGAAGAAVGVTTGVILDKQEEKLRKAGIRAEKDEKGNLLISMAGDALRFETGSDTLSDSGKQQLYKVASVLKEYPENRIAVQGHTDSDGSDDANLKLSNLRALAAANTLRGYGVPARCIVQTKGFGESYPVASNSTSAGKAANRRVDLIISADEKEAEANQKEREKYRR